MTHCPPAPLHSVANMPDANADMELIFHGTGTSSGLPLIECVTATPDARHCKTCTSTDKLNRRRNTGAIVRKRVDGDEWMYVLWNVVIFVVVNASFSTEHSWLMSAKPSWLRPWNGFLNTD